MNCWIFPGQPVTFTDMPCCDEEFQEIAVLCRKTTGFDPLESGNAASNLNESVRLQLFGACVSLHHFNQLTRQGIRPDLISEHSMGIYSALAASGSIDCATALDLTCRIGAAMAEKFSQGEYALGCVIGLTRSLVESVTANNGISIANHNTSHHFLLAGERIRINAAMLEASAAGAFSVSVFPCDAPLHTPLIEEIAEDLKRIVDQHSFREPVIPLIEHIGQTALNAAAIPAFLVEELYRPVYWEKTYRQLRSRGATRFQEVGAGSSLAKFNRWIDSKT